MESSRADKEKGVLIGPWMVVIPRDWGRRREMKSMPFKEPLGNQEEPDPKLLTVGFGESWRRL
jgi:hypothetical protein